MDLPDRPAGDGPSRNGGGPPLPPARVLVVDDGDTADSLGLLAHLWGYGARVAHDGPSALRLAREYKPDVVFLNAGLPGADQVASQLRRDVRLVVLAEADDPRSLGGYDHQVARPLDPDVLRRLLDGWHLAAGQCRSATENSAVL